MTVQISTRPLTLRDAERHLGDALSGAVVLFVGRVRRDSSRGRQIAALDYESDRALALERLRTVERQAVRLFRVRRVYIIHRIGRIRVGAASVVIGVSAGHRSTAFRAARFLIEELKREVPIWKSDRWARGPAARPRHTPPRPRGRRSPG